jgi:translation initiation factor IF-2
VPRPRRPAARRRRPPRRGLAEAEPGPPQGGAGAQDTGDGQPAPGGGRTCGRSRSAHRRRRRSPAALTLPGSVWLCIPAGPRRAPSGPQPALQLHRRPHRPRRQQQLRRRQRRAGRRGRGAAGLWPVRHQHAVGRVERGGHGGGQPRSAESHGARWHRHGDACLGAGRPGGGAAGRRARGAAGGHPLCVGAVHAAAAQCRGGAVPGIHLPGWRATHGACSPPGRLGPSPRPPRGAALPGGGPAAGGRRRGGGARGGAGGGGAAGAGGARLAG